MHIAAMSPKVISPDELDDEFITDQLAVMNHKIDQDNESRAFGKQEAITTPCLWFRKTIKR